MRGTAGSAAVPAASCRNFRRRSVIAPSCLASLALDACRLDNWPPFFDFSSMNGTKPFRRLLLGRRNSHALIGDAPTYRRIGQCVHDRDIELGDDVPRRALRGPK